MDIEVVNTILRMCIEKQTCLFEMSHLHDHFVKQNLCTNIRYVLASVMNFVEIFKISADKSRIELYMPFEICQNEYTDGICHDGYVLCSNLHICYDYLYTNSCRYSNHCPYPHVLTERLHKTTLKSLSALDLELLTKAFRVYCQSKRRFVDPYVTKGQQVTSNSLSSNNSTLSSMANGGALTKRVVNGNTSWKTNPRYRITLRTLPNQPKPPDIPEKGVQVCWSPEKHIQSHFIEVIFSSQGKSNGGPIRTHRIFQHLGVAQIFYQVPDVAEQVVLHGPITFQSFVFTPRVLKRKLDRKRICLSNIPTETSQLASYIAQVSMPHRPIKFEHHQDDPHTVIVEYTEDIDFSKISCNIRRYSGGTDRYSVNCIQLYEPEVLLVEYEPNYSLDHIRQLLTNMNIFHIQTYDSCCFIHFFTHEDLLQSISHILDKSVRTTAIYIDIYEEHHLNSYLQRRQIQMQEKCANRVLTYDLQNIVEKQSFYSAEDLTPSSPILSPPKLETDNSLGSISPVENQTQISQKNVEQEAVLPQSQSQMNIEESQPETTLVNDKNETTESEDDFHDLPSDFDNDDLLLDDPMEDQSDMEYLRSAARNLMTSLSEMDEASGNTEGDDTPRSVLYGDDYVIIIKSRRFSLAFLDYTHFRVEKQRNPEKFRLVTSLRKSSHHRTPPESLETPDQIVTATPTSETKTQKKKRNKHNRKKKTANTDDKNDDQVI